MLLVPGSPRRDTVVACVCGNGDKLPMYWIQHEPPRYRQDRASGLRVQERAGVAGMSLARMLEWAETYKDDFRPDSVLVLDRLRAHLNAEVAEVLSEAGLTVCALPVKGALLLSPLDNGFLSEFKRLHETAMARRPVEERWRKWNAACEAYDAVPPSHIQAYFRNCGLIGEESLQAVRHRFLSRTGQLLDRESDQLVTTFERWTVGELEIDGANRLRNYTTDRPTQLPDSALDGSYWLSWGTRHGACQR